MDRGTLIRTYTAGDLGFILHSPASIPMAHGLCAAPKKCRAAPRRESLPHARAVEPAVPAFINIGQRFDVGEGEELKAFTTAGFLGSELVPFNIPFRMKPLTRCGPPAA